MSIPEEASEPKGAVSPEPPTPRDHCASAGSKASCDRHKCLFVTTLSFNAILTGVTFLAPICGIHMAHTNNLLTNVAILAPYYFVVFTYCISYYYCMVTDAGCPPRHDIIEDVLVCKKCGYARPERCHHCRICNRCTLIYDHHCPWVGNCIGAHNHGYFIRFLLHGFISCAYSLYISLWHLLRWRYFTMLRIDILAWVVLTTILIQVISVFLTLTMLIACIPMVCHNETSVEAEINREFRKITRIKRKNFTYPYNRGLVANLRELFGRNFLVGLLLPTEICPYLACSDAPNSHDSDGLRKKRD